MKNDNIQKTSKGKLTLTEFKAEQFIESTVNEKMQSYSDEDIKDQIDILTKIIDKIKIDKSEKKSLKDIEKEIYFFLKDIFNQIEQPTANDFFRLRTFEYIVKNKIDIEARVKAILESGVNVLEVKDNLYINNQVYSGNIEKNIDTFLCESISELQSHKYSISERFNNMIKKISNNELKPSDAPLLSKYLKRFYRKYTYWKR